MAQNPPPAVVTIFDLVTGSLSSSALFEAAQTTNGVATTNAVTPAQIVSAAFGSTIVPVTLGGTNTSNLTLNGVIYGNNASTVGITAAGGTSIPLLGQGAGNAPAFAVLPVIGGGTNTTILTQNGILFGNGSSTVGITGAGNTALVLISPGPLQNPIFGQVSMTAAVTGVLSVANGGTQTSTLTQNGVLYGNAANTVGITAAGATSVPLLGQGAGNAPAFGVLPVIGGGTNTTTLTQNGLLFGNGSSTVGITGAGNTALVLISPGPLQNPIFGQVSMTAAVTGVLGVANGGSGTSTLTAHGVLIGEGTSTVAILAAATANFVLAGVSTTADPAFTGTPSIATSLAVGTTNLPGAGNFYVQGFLNSVAGFSRVTANYSTVSTTFANVTGLSAAVVTAGTYSFEAVLFATAGATGGTKVQIACTAGASNVIYDGVSYAAGALLNQARATALLAAVATATTATTPTFRVIGNLTTITTGAITVQIAQVAATTTSTVILGGSFMQVFQMN